MTSPRPTSTPPRHAAIARTFIRKPGVRRGSAEAFSRRQKITVSGRATYDTPRREGEGHGDLVMALALALAVPNTLRKPDLIDRE